MRHLCGERGYRYNDEVCETCLVVEDALLERGVELPGDLVTGCLENPQEWRLADVEEVVVDVDNGSDEPDFTWVLKVAGKWLAVRGWHDYSGWDCQSGLTTETYETREAALATLVDWERMACTVAGIAVLP